MRRALTPRRSETKLDNLMWASSSRASSWFCNRTLLTAGTRLPSWRERRACYEFLKQGHRLSPLSQEGRDNVQLFRSTTHAPDQTHRQPQPPLKLQSRRSEPVWKFVARRAALGLPARGCLPPSAAGLNCPASMLAFFLRIATPGSLNASISGSRDPCVRLSNDR